MPRHGALYFFYAGQHVAAGFQPDDRGAWQVLYSAESIDGLPLRNFPDDIVDDLRVQGGPTSSQNI